MMSVLILSAGSFVLALAQTKLRKGASVAALLLRNASSRREAISGRNQRPYRWLEDLGQTFRRGAQNDYRGAGRYPIAMIKKRASHSWTIRRASKRAAIIWRAGVSKQATGEDNRKLYVRDGAGG
jgi:hypothetical protein